MTVRWSGQGQISKFSDKSLIALGDSKTCIYFKVCLDEIFFLNVLNCLCELTS